MPQFEITRYFTGRLGGERCAGGSNPRGRWVRLLRREPAAPRPRGG